MCMVLDLPETILMGSEKGVTQTAVLMKVVVSSQRLSPLETNSWCCVFNNGKAIEGMCLTSSASSSAKKTLSPSSTTAAASTSVRKG